MLTPMHTWWPGGSWQRSVQISEEREVCNLICISTLASHLKRGINTKRRNAKQNKGEIRFLGNFPQRVGEVMVFSEFGPVSTVARTTSKRKKTVYHVLWAENGRLSRNPQLLSPPYHLPDFFLAEKHLKNRGASAGATRTPWMSPTFRPFIFCWTP